MNCQNHGQCSAFTYHIYYVSNFSADRHISFSIYYKYTA